MSMQHYHHVWGFIPTFLDEANPKSTIEQLDEGYVSGWRPFNGFELNKNTLALSYDGDPDMHPIDKMQFRDDVIAIYPHEWVMVLMPDGKYEVCRMD